MFTRSHRHISSASPFGSSAAYLRMQARSAPDPAHPHICVAGRVPGRAPTREELRHIFAEVADRVPALGYRVAGSGRHARLEPAADFDVSRHIEDVLVPAGQSPAQCVLEASQRPLPRDRPPWSIQLIRGYSTDEYVLSYRADHLLQDGMAAAQTMAAAFCGGRLPRPAPQPAPRAPSLRTVRSCLRLLPNLLGPTAQWLPLYVPRGLGRVRGRVLHTVTVDRASFDDITRHTGAGTAQIALAVLTGALRAWTPRHWCGPTARSQRRGLRTYLTVSLRHRRDRAALGNLAGVVPLMLPCAEPSPARRLARIVERTGFDTLHRYRQFFSWLLRLPHPPARLLRRCMNPFAPPGLGVTIASAGPDENDLGVAELIAVPPLPSRTPGACMFVYDKTRVSVSFLFDSAIPDTDRLPGLLTAALAELHSGVVAPRPHSPEHAAVADVPTPRPSVHPPAPSKPPA